MMTFNRLLLPVFAALVPVVLPAQQGAPNLNDSARLVAGLPLPAGSALEPLMRLPVVQQHYLQSRELNEKWEETRLAAMREWARTEVHPRISRPRVVKYLFGGPDFVHVATLFPGAPEYVLVGLEPLGNLPDFRTMNEAQMAEYLPHLTHTLRSISRRNFFITTEMREDFGDRGVNGVFPVLLYFAALTNHDVTGADFVKLDGTGEVVPASADDASGLHLRLRMRMASPGAPPEISLYYFKTDLSNGGFKPGTSFLRFLEERPGGVGYLKAASFLMHQEGFTNVRNFLVGDLDYILQDASGIPAEFLALYYDITYYGNYAGPIEMFSEYDQPALHRIYQSGVAKPLPFGTGYRYSDSDSIQLFGSRK